MDLTRCEQETHYVVSGALLWCKVARSAVSSPSVVAWTVEVVEVDLVT